MFFDEMEILKAHGYKVVPFSRHFEKNITSEHTRFFPPSMDYENVSFFKKASSAFKLVYSYESMRKFNELLSFFNPDLIHSHNIYGRLTTSIIDAAKKRRIPLVMTLHDYKLICPSYLMLSKGRICERCKNKYFFNCTISRCHKGSMLSSLIYTIESYFNSVFRKYSHIRYLICPSGFLLRKHAEAGLPEEKLVYIPNFINANDIESNYAHRGYILFVGRLSKEKGLLTLLNAVKGLDVPLRIAGDGPMRTEYEIFVSDYNMKNVTFEGYRSGEELQGLFRNASFLVFPSEWYENAPMTVLEAFAYGKPVIGSDIGGIPEMVVEGKTGLLFKAGDQRELTEKIDYMITNPSKIQEMGRRAREKVGKEFNADVHYKKLIDIYEKALV